MNINTYGCVQPQMGRELAQGPKKSRTARIH